MSSVLAGMLLICIPALGADAGKVSVIVREAGSPALLPCRAWVTVGNRRLFEAESTSCTPYARDRSFSCDGRFVVTVPLGESATGGLPLSGSARGRDGLGTQGRDALATRDGLGTQGRDALATRDGLMTQGRDALATRDGLGTQGRDALATRDGLGTQGRDALATKAVIHVERGKEYWPVDKEIVVEEGRTAEVEITLKRWVHIAKEGWYSGDVHCHFGLNDLDVLKQLALADDVNFQPILTLWNYQSPAPPGGVWPDWPGGSSVYADTSHLVTLRNQEIERIGGDAFESVGALLMMGLARPVEMPPRGSRYPCDAVLGRIAKATSPRCVIDTDKPIWGENVVGVALGLFDSVQVCHNHYHREATLQDGRIGWGMADAENDRDEPSQDELFHRTNSTYYRFLNCGFRLAVTGGSAMGVMAVPLGYGRTYAKLKGPLSEAAYLDAIRAGRTFATNGPMLILTANGLDCGAEIDYPLDSDRPIWIRADLRSIQWIDSLEIIYSGKVIKRIDLEDEDPSPILRESAAMGLKPLRSGWVAARATFTGPDGHLRQAHTSPVYVTVDGKPIASKANAEYMIGWIDRLLEVSDKPSRYKSDDERTQTQAIFREARHVYENIARKAADIWRDS